MINSVKVEPDIKLVNPAQVDITQMSTWSLNSMQKKTETSNWISESHKNELKFCIRLLQTSPRLTRWRQRSTNSVYELTVVRICSTVGGWRRVRLTGTSESSSPKHTCTSCAWRLDTRVNRRCTWKDFCRHRSSTSPAHWYRLCWQARFTNHPFLDSRSHQLTNVAAMVKWQQTEFARAENLSKSN